MIRDLLELRPFHLTIAKPPHETTSAEAEEQFRELMDRMPSFLAYIESVLEAEGMNLSKEPTQVMDDVGEWLVSKASLVDLPPTSGWLSDGEVLKDLSLPSKSAAYWIGLLFAKLLMKEIPSLSWKLSDDHPNDANHHRAIVVSPKTDDELPPEIIVMNFVASRLKGRHTRTLGTLFSIWKEVLE